MSKKGGKHKGSTDNLIGVILERHSDTDANLLYEAVYKKHPLLGKMMISNVTEIMDRILNLPWRLSLTTMAWGTNEQGEEVYAEDEQVLEQRLRLGEADPLAEQQLKTLADEFEVEGIDIFKIGYRIHILGR